MTYPKIHAAVQAKIRRLLHGLVQFIGQMQGANLPTLALNPNGLSQIHPIQPMGQSIHEMFLAGLGNFSQVAKGGTFVTGQALQIQNLLSGSGQFVECLGFGRTGPSAQDEPTPGLSPQRWHAAPPGLVTARVALNRVPRLPHQQLHPHRSLPTPPAINHP